MSVFREIPYGQWRDLDPEDTMSFYALRLSRLGMLDHLPGALVKRSSNWGFLNELKHELKA